MRRGSEDVSELVHQIDPLINTDSRLPSHQLQQHVPFWLLVSQCVLVLLCQILLLSRCRSGTVWVRTNLA
jgi:hypothetical protein